MDKKLLGQILASVVLAAIGAGEILVNDQGHPTDTKQIDDLFSGFLGIWKPQITGGK
jgi:hypothetical protein